ncbi:MAG: benzoate-CoA ligase family protein [Myxococcota bacterium]|nr:benzoate-CoA ligase family protein [Myxococcota bacterium]
MHEQPTFPERFNMADYFLDARIREGRGARVAVKVGDRRWTYDEMQSLANRASFALRDRGIDLEDRVLLLLFDGIEFAAAWFGILKSGAVFCMGNPLATEADLDYLLGYTRARAVIADASTMDRLAPALAKHPRCRVRLVVGELSAEMERAGFEAWEPALAASSDRTENADTSRDDVAGWLFTSGTTGKPKGAVHFHHDFPYNTELYPKQVLQLREDDVFLSVSRLFFGYATGTNLMFPFRFGGTAVFFADKPTPERLFAEIAKHGVTVLSNVPAMIRQMLDHPESASADLSTLRMCLSAGEALPAPLYERWRARGWCEILDGIGSAELFHIYISNAPGDVKLGSLGKLVPGYEARIVGAEGQDVADGDIGRLWVRGDSAALCYWGDAEKSKSTFVGGDWVVSADLFQRDAEGYYYYSGRGDDILKVRGMFVSPLEVEDCLATHEAVQECAVVGALDEDGMSVPKAVVVLRAGFARDATMIASLQEHTKTRLARYKFPRIVRFVDALPRNDRGKVLRRELADV